jgi:hypothetical protein
MRLGAPLALILLGAFHAAAQDEISVPGRFVKIDTAGKVRIYAPNEKTLGPASRSEFTGKIRDIWTAFNEIYHIDVAYVTAGVEGSTFQRLERQQVNLVLFDNEADRDDWFLKSGLKGNVVHVDRYQNAIGYALTDGVVGNDAWVSLWRQFSHVFVWHHLYFGAPVWLDYGLAEHYAWQNKHVVRPTDFAEFNGMLGRLREGKNKGTNTPVERLLLKDAETFGQEDIDAAWVLTNFIMMECRPVFEDLWNLLTSQQSVASGDVQGIVSDARRLSKFSLERAFGGAAGLQSAWEYHLEALLKSPTLPAKLKSPPKAGKGEPSFFDMDFLAVPPEKTPDPSGAMPTDATLSGSCKPSAPWPGTVSVTAAVGDGKGKWSKEYEVGGGRADKKGTPVNWKDEKVPVGATGRRVRITVTYKVDGGGTYQATQVRDIGKSK